MAPLVQPLDRALPLHPARRHPAARRHQCPRLYIRRALARPEPEAVGLGLARRAVHPAGGHGEEGPPAVAGTCLRVYQREARSHSPLFSHTVWG